MERTEATKLMIVLTSIVVLVLSILLVYNGFDNVIGVALFISILFEAFLVLATPNKKEIFNMANFIRNNDMSENDDTLEQILTEEVGSSVKEIMVSSDDQIEDNEDDYTRSLPSTARINHLRDKALKVFGLPTEEDVDNEEVEDEESMYDPSYTESETTIDFEADSVYTILEKAELIREETKKYMNEGEDTTMRKFIKEAEPVKEEVLPEVTETNDSNPFLWSNTKFVNTHLFHYLVSNTTKFVIDISGANLYFIDMNESITEYTYLDNDNNLHEETAETPDDSFFTTLSINLAEKMSTILQKDSTDTESPDTIPLPVIYRGECNGILYATYDVSRVPLIEKFIKINTMTKEDIWKDMMKGELL